MTDRRPIAALPTQWPCPHRLGPKICVPATSRAPHFWFLRYRTGVVEIVVDQNPVPMRRSICQRPAAGDKSTQAAPPDWIHAAPQIFNQIRSNGFGTAGWRAESIPALGRTRHRQEPAAAAGSRTAKVKGRPAGTGQRRLKSIAWRGNTG